jgi:hypothetical protein
MLSERDVGEATWRPFLSHVRRGDRHVSGFGWRKAGLYLGAYYLARKAARTAHPSRNAIETHLKQLAPDGSSPIAADLFLLPLFDFVRSAVQFSADSGAVARAEAGVRAHFAALRPPPSETFRIEIIPIDSTLFGRDLSPGREPDMPSFLPFDKASIMLTSDRPVHGLVRTFVMRYDPGELLKRPWDDCIRWPLPELRLAHQRTPLAEPWEFYDVPGTFQFCSVIAANFADIDSRCTDNPETWSEGYAQTFALIEALRSEAGWKRKAFIGRATRPYRVRVASSAT